MDGWIQKYREEILPGIEKFMEEEGSAVFTASEIEPYVEGISPSEIGRTLTYVWKDGDSGNLEKVSSAPGTWQLVDDELEPEAEEQEQQTEEEILEEAYSKVARNGEVPHEQLVSFLVDRIEHKSGPHELEYAADLIDRLREEYDIEGDSRQGYSLA